MSSRVQMIHRLDGDEHSEIELRAIFWVFEPKIQFVASRDDVLNDLVDRVLIRTRPFSDESPNVTPDRVNEA